MIRLHRFTHLILILIGCVSFTLISFAQPFNSQYQYGSGSYNASSTTDFIINVPTSMLITKIRVRLSDATSATALTQFWLDSPSDAVSVLLCNDEPVGGMDNTVFDDAGVNGPIASAISPAIGYFTPDAPLSQLNGLNTQGNWTLRVISGAGNSGIWEGGGFELEFNNIILPVEMTSFSAEGGDNQVSLNWHTETETNNAHFNLYRSLTRPDRGDLITEIEGHGTTVTPHSYSFLDNRVQNGTTYYYRISNVDLNGIEQMYSIVVQATVSATLLLIPTQYSLSQNFPNPFNPTTGITYSIPNAGHVSLTLTDMIGRNVATLVNGYQAANVYHVTVDGSKLPSGMYFYTLKTDEAAFTKRMILLK